MARLRPGHIRVEPRQPPRCVCADSVASCSATTRYGWSEGANKIGKVLIRRRICDVRRCSSFCHKRKNFQAMRKRLSRAKCCDAAKNAENRQVDECRGGAGDAGQVVGRRDSRSRRRACAVVWGARSRLAPLLTGLRERSRPWYAPVGATQVATTTTKRRRKLSQATRPVRGNDQIIRTQRTKDGAIAAASDRGLRRCHRLAGSR